MAILVQGSTGQEVRNLQTGLNYHLSNSPPRLVVDGIFGPKTRARLVQFQTRFGLKPDGVVGPITHRALYTFVDCFHHLFVVTETESKKAFAATGKGLSFGDNNSSNGSPSVLPPLPRLQLSFPQALPPVPIVLQPPRLELDPKLLLLSRKTKWEIEAGQETSFKTDLGTGKTEREVAIVGGVTGTVWSKPIGKNVEFTAGGGIVVEKRIKPDPQTEAKVFIFAKTEVKDIFKLGPLDLAKLTAEAQVGGKLGGKEPPDLSVSVGLGPEVELFGGKVTFGPGAYFQYETNGQTHIVSGQVKFSGTFHF
jgi:hypothetical protein